MKSNNKNKNTPCYKILLRHKSGYYDKIKRLHVIIYYRYCKLIVRNRIDLREYFLLGRIR